MSINKTELLTMLKNGKTTDELATEMTAALNEAIAEYKEECAKAEAEKKAAEELENLKAADFQEMVETILDYVYAYYVPDEHSDAFCEVVERLDYKELMSTFDDSIEEIMKLIETLTVLKDSPLFAEIDTTPLFAKTESAAPIKPKVTTKIEELTDEEADAIIENMLKKFGF